MSEMQFGREEERGPREKEGVFLLLSILALHCCTWVALCTRSSGSSSVPCSFFIPFLLGWSNKNVSGPNPSYVLDRDDWSQASSSLRGYPEESRDDYVPRVSASIVTGQSAAVRDLQLVEGMALLQQWQNQEWSGQPRGWSMWHYPKE